MFRFAQYDKVKSVVVKAETLRYAQSDNPGIQAVILKLSIEEH